MSIGGRSRIWQRTTFSDVPIRGAAQAPIDVCLNESFNQADSATIGPDLEWLSAGAETHDGKFVALSGSIPVTYTESFDKANSTVIGPDRTWNKVSFASGGSAGGVIRSNAYAVVGNPDADLFAECHIYLDNAQHSFNRQAVIHVEAEIVARSALGTGAGQVDYSEFTLSLGSGPFAYGAAACQFTNNGPGAPPNPEVVWIRSLSGDVGPIAAAFGVGDVLGMTVTPNSPGSSQATIEAEVNGLVVATLTNATGWDFAPAGLELTASCVSQATFTAGGQDRLDNFVASGEWTATGAGVAYTVDEVGSDDMTVSATIADFDDSGSGLQFQLYARVGGTGGPEDAENAYEARFQSNNGNSFVDVGANFWGPMTDQLAIPLLQVGDELAFTVTGTTDDFRVVCTVNGDTVLDWDAAELSAWNGIDPADFQGPFGFGDATGQRAGLGVVWQGVQDANALDTWSACPV